MNEMYTAIYNKITSSNDLDTEIGSRYYTEKAPDNVSFPYVVGHLIVSSDDSTFTEQLDKITFQFNCYSDDECSTVEIGTVYKYLRALMDDALLTVTDHIHYYCSWQNSRGARWIPGENVWQYVVEYEIEIEQNR